MFIYKNTKKKKKPTGHNYQHTYSTPHTQAHNTRTSTQPHTTQHIYFLLNSRLTEQCHR